VLLASADPWFLRLFTIAMAAFVLTASIVASVYIVLFKHFEWLLLRPPSVSHRWFHQRTTDSSNTASTPNAPWPPRLGSPAFRAVQRFTAATLARSQLHQGVVLGLSACGLSLALSRLVSSNLLNHIGSAAPPSLSFIGGVAWAPFALMFVCG